MPRTHYGGEGAGGRPAAGVPKLAGGGAAGLAGAGVFGDSSHGDASRCRRNSRLRRLTAPKQPSPAPHVAGTADGGLWPPRLVAEGVGESLGYQDGDGGLGREEVGEEIKEPKLPLCLR